MSVDRDLLRFLTCGSVDDGKSSLIGRLLYDSQQVYDDQVKALAKDSRKFGTMGEEVDLALLMDGLESEREQSITIDVGYRYFSTERRSFIVADTPGHEQFTRNMATGASNSDLAVILVDARKGVISQTRRHAAICSMLGIRQLVLAVNKMDLVAFSREMFDRIAAEFAEFASRLSFLDVVSIPISAKIGDNVVRPSKMMPWYSGPTLLHHLETVDPVAEAREKPFRLPVQWVNRPNAEFRGFSGTVAGGVIRKGDTIVVYPAGGTSRIEEIVGGDGSLDEATSGDAVTLRLQDEIAIARGDIIAGPVGAPVVSDQFTASILWMGAEPLFPGRSYLMRIGMRWVPATVSSIEYQLDVTHLDHLAAKSLELNEIGMCNVMTAQAVAFDAYQDNRDTGAFILVDRYTFQTVGAGMIAFQLHRGDNFHPEKLAIDKAARSLAKHQRPCVLWFTGLSAAGKTTIGRMVEGKLHLAGCHTYMMDGDNVRHGLNHDLGFTDADRVENIRRVGEVSKLFVDAGLIVLCAFISPFQAERRSARDLFEPGEFVEIFVDTPLEECIRRDPKGLYAKALSGALRNFTGIDSAYEPPEDPQLRLKTFDHSADQLSEIVVEYLRRTGYFT